MSENSPRNFWYYLRKTLKFLLFPFLFMANPKIYIAKEGELSQGDGVDK